MKNSELNTQLQGNLTVEGLRDLLDQAIRDGKGDMPVGFSYNCKDHWNTEVVKPLSEDAEEKYVTYSGYHNSIRIDDDYGAEEGEQGVKVFMLNAARLNSLR